VEHCFAYVWYQAGGIERSSVDDECLTSVFVVDEKRALVGVEFE